MSVARDGAVIIEIEGVDIPMMLQKGEQLNHRTVDGEERIELKRQGVPPMAIAIARISTA